MLVIIIKDIPKMYTKAISLRLQVHFCTSIPPEKHFSAHVVFLTRGGEQKVLKEMEDYIAFPWHKALKQA